MERCPYKRGTWWNFWRNYVRSDLPTRKEHGATKLTAKEG